MAIGRRSSMLIVLMVMISVISACTGARPPGTPEAPEPSQPQVKKPDIPSVLGAKPNQEPRLRVYIKEEGVVKEMPFEEYVAGVVGGEIKNDWPEEAIKAQAIIARTFVLQFVESNKGSKYANAHISTDIEEAQAWNKDAVNARIKKAVKDTRGQVVVHDGDYAHAWFHSNAGGRTATAVEGLNFKDGNPPYIRVVNSPDESPNVPAEERTWTVDFSKEEVLQAARNVGKPVQDFSKITIGSKGPSGRAMVILLDDTEVPAPELRIELGSTKMKSTMLDEVKIEEQRVVFKGKGYGHGVGMSQWGAYEMAKQGKKAQDIIHHYFKGVEVIKMWQ